MTQLADQFVPSWIEVHPINPARCSVCGGFATDGWTWKTSPTTSTRFVCADCAEKA